MKFVFQSKGANLWITTPAGNAKFVDHVFITTNPELARHLQQHPSNGVLFTGPIIEAVEAAVAPMAAKMCEDLGVDPNQIAAEQGILPPTEVGINHVLKFLWDHPEVEPNLDRQKLTKHIERAIVRAVHDELKKAHKED